MTTWRDFYAHVTNPFRSKGPFYSGPGHHGVDFAVDVHGDVPAYFTGECVLNGHSSVLGNWAVYRRADGMYAGYAHLLVGTRRNVGNHVVPGDSIGKAAGRDDDHGSAWTGPHCHTTVSAFTTGIYDGRVIDPWPSIRAAIARVQIVSPKTVVVKKNDTLTKIAARAKTTVKRLLVLNRIEDEDHIWVGQKVRVR